MIMKTNVIAFLTMTLLISTSCQKKIDILKEQEAIKSVMEEEKNSFFNKDPERMAATWIQKPSSIKLYMMNTGQIQLIGWDKIYESDKKYMETDTLDRKNMKIIFSDYQFNIYENNAWVFFKATWNVPYNDSIVAFEQTRISAFEKSDGKWKYKLMAIYNIPPKEETVSK